MATIWPQSTFKQQAIDGTTNSSNVAVVTLSDEFTADDYLVIGLLGDTTETLVIDGFTTINTASANGKRYVTLGAFKDSKTTITVRSGSATRPFTGVITAVSNVDRANPINKSVNVAEEVVETGTYTAAGTDPIGASDHVVGVGCFFGHSKDPVTVFSGNVIAEDARFQGDIFGAWAGVNFNTSGTVTSHNSKVMTRYEGNWLSSDQSSDYEMRFEPDVGSVPSDWGPGVPLNAWTAVPLAVYTRTLDAGGGGPGNQYSIYATGNVHIRKAGTTTILGTWSLNFLVNNGTPF